MRITRCLKKPFWVSDSKKKTEKKVSADRSGVKELRFKAGLFIPKEGEVLLSFHLPYKANRLAIGDINGDGSPEVIIASGSKIRTYRLGVDLKSLDEFNVPSTDEVIWIDTITLNRNGKDVILITTMRDGEVTSYIYELKDSKYVQLWEAKNRFIRKLGKGIIAQEFNKAEGYEGEVFFLEYNNGNFTKGESLKLPRGINIYDFQRLGSSDGKEAILAWDENGYLGLYNEKGMRLWMSKEDFGGFATTFKKESPTIMVDRGKWSVKDRLIISGGEVLVPKRKPLLGMARGLGYKDSEIKGLWWNGISIEERNFIERAGGELLDYDMLGDRIAVLSKVPFTIKAKNLLKGESPFGVMLYIFAIKGR
ncbi:MAG: VCBS repeat-containing protein [Nitrospirae bacterium]|nr:VCBS repeat-containing protein [Nitrospirota bacterium]